MPGAPILQAVFSERLVVGVGDLAVSNRENLTISTYALGSCVALVAYHPQRRAGGLIHLMLPESRLSPDRARKHPAVFADSGLALFFRELEGIGLRSKELRFFMGGGANVINQGNDLFRIGERNVAATKAFLQGRGLRAHLSSTGGFSNRTVHLELATGVLTIKMPEGQKKTILQ